jgi:hypothetical protein
LTLAACSANPPAAGGASLTITPNLQNYGSVVLNGQSAPVTFTVTNSGGVPSAPLETAITGADASSFTRVTDDCGTALAPASSCTLTVRFNPTGSGPKSALLTLGAVTATLYGTGQAPGLVTLSPTPQDFGTVLVNTSGTDSTFTATNSGGSLTGVLAIALGGADATQFSIAPGGSCVTGTRLQPAGTDGASCTILVHFSPTAGGPSVATLTVTPADASPVSAALTGSGQLPAQLRLSPNVQDFGQVVVGTLSASVPVTVTNIGGAATTELSNAFSGVDSSQFSLVAGGCAGAPLAAGASCVLTVRFDPTRAGSAAASLDFTSAGSGVHASASLTAEGITAPLLTLTPGPATFAQTAVGATSVSVTFTVTNTGTAPSGSLITSLGGAAPAEFPVVPDSNGCQGVVLGSGETCTIALRFAPVAAGSRTASLTVSANPGSSATANLSGNASSPASLLLSPAGQEFGSVGVGASNGGVTFTVTNKGDSPSGAPSVGISGLGALHFVLLANGCTTGLSPAGQAGSSCTFTVDFAPTSTGTKDASLDVSASPGGARSSPLLGVGISPAALTLTGSLNFGNVTVGQSATVTFTVTNLGAAPAGTMSFALSGLNSGDFSLLAPTGSDCVPATTVLGGFAGAPAVPSSCTVQVRFAPTSGVGLVNSKTAALTVTGTPGGAPSLPLNGNARALVTIAPNSPALDGNFGTALVGVGPGTAPTITFTLVNNSTVGGLSSGALVLSVIGPDASQFVITGGTCISGTTNLAPTAACTITAQFRPTTTSGAKTATLRAAGTAPTSTPTIVLVGVAL